MPVIDAKDLFDARRKANEAPKEPIVGNKIKVNIDTINPPGFPEGVYWGLDIYSEKLQSFVKTDVWGYGRYYEVAEGFALGQADEMSRTPIDVLIQNNLIKAEHFKE